MYIINTNRKVSQNGLRDTAKVLRFVFFHE